MVPRRGGLRACALTIRPLDTSSDLELEQYRALEQALDDHVYGGHQEESLAQPARRPRGHPVLDGAALDRARRDARGWGDARRPRDDLHAAEEENLESISVGVAVHPAHRGQGIATALVEEAPLPAIEQSGRTLVEAYGEIEAGVDSEDPAHPVHRIAARLGVTRKNLAVCRALPPPLDPARLDALEAESAQKRGEYRIEQWVGEIPEEHLSAYGRSLTQLEIDEPDEEVEHEPAEYTPERIRVSERRMREAGTIRIVAVAVAPDGEFVGNSEVHVHEAPGGDPRLPGEHPGHARAPRAPAGPRAQGRHTPAPRRARPAAALAGHLELAREPVDDPGQREARV
ncbi:GNAT family N-acetyltransferase [Brachybacterium sp. GPGPB12]|uniref:GNAT family N-acetyltransferase n=1 Tax=Brachybacterium sp. GPGPB12 TaxID=3023517 RepID=UPI00313426FB